MYCHVYQDENRYSFHTDGVALAFLIFPMASLPFDVPLVTDTVAYAVTDDMGGAPVEEGPCNPLAQAGFWDWAICGVISALVVAILGTIALLTTTATAGTALAALGAGGVTLAKFFGVASVGTFLTLVGGLAAGALCKCIADRIRRN